MSDAFRDYNREPETWDEVGIDLSQMRAGKTVCPACDSTRKHKGQRDLSIDLAKGAYHCWNNGCDFKGYLRGYNQTWTPGAKQYVKPAAPRTSRITPKGEVWLAKRGISLETAERYGLYSETRGDIGEVVAFPYRDQYGDLVHIKYRAITPIKGEAKTIRVTKDTERVFYGLNNLTTTTRRVIITEGEPDVLALAEAGIANAISVPDGANVRKQGEKLAAMAGIADLLEWAEDVVIATDGDEAGDSLAAELIRRIGRHKCRRVVFPAGAKDANDVLMRDGAAAVRDLIARAQFVPVEGIISIRDYADEIWEHREQINQKRGWQVPSWPRLSDLYRMEPGQLTIILASPESGKSSWMRSYLSNLARAHHQVFAGLFVPEDSPEREFWIKMLRLELGQMQYIPESERQRYDEVVSFVDDHFRIITPPQYSLEGIIELGKVMVYRHGMNTLLVDPWTEVRYDHLSNVGEYRQIELALSQLREFGKQYGVAVNVVVHPRKPNQSSSGNDDFNPYDARGTATWYDKADRFIIMRREDKNAVEDVTTVKVSKTRNKAFGRNGEVRFVFDSRTERFYEEDSIRAFNQEGDVSWTK